MECLASGILLPGMEGGREGGRGRRGEIKREGEGGRRGGGRDREGGRKGEIEREEGSGRVFRLQDVMSQRVCVFVPPPLARRPRAA